MICDDHTNGRPLQIIFNKWRNLFPWVHRPKTIQFFEQLRFYQSLFHRSSKSNCTKCNGWVIYLLFQWIQTLFFRKKYQISSNIPLIWDEYFSIFWLRSFQFGSSKWIYLDKSANCQLIYLKSEIFRKSVVQPKNIRHWQHSMWHFESNIECCVCLHVIAWL